MCPEHLVCEDCLEDWLEENPWLVFPCPVCRSPAFRDYVAECRIIRIYLHHENDFEEDLQVSLRGETIAEAFQVVSDYLREHQDILYAIYRNRGSIRFSTEDEKYTYDLSMDILQDPWSDDMYGEGFEECQRLSEEAYYQKKKEEEEDDHNRYLDLAG
jgi:hypothetical protein